MGLELIHGSYLVTDGDHRTSEEGICCRRRGDGHQVRYQRHRGWPRGCPVAIDRYSGGDGDISEVLLDLEVPDQRIGKPV